VKRAGHYLVAEQLLEQASEDQATAARTDSATKRAILHGDVRLYLRAAQIHAQLACAGPGVEQEVGDLLKRAALPQAERQAARPPLADGRPKPHPPLSKERS